jgi:hypothetical protein
MLKQLKLKTSAINVDARYQRNLDEKRVRNMVESFDEDRLGVFTVSHRKDDSYWMLDGQHRKALLAAVGKEDLSVLCFVHEGLSLDEEAAWFIALQEGRVSVCAMDKFRARLVAKEPVACEIASIAKAAGLLLFARTSEFKVVAVQAIEWAHTKKQNLPAVFRVLREWANGDRRAFDGAMVKAVASFLAYYPSADPDVLVSALATKKPVEIMSLITRAASTRPRWVAACDVLREQYNKKISRNKSKLPPVEWLG